VESPFAGSIRLLAETGTTMKVGTPIAEIIS
jgi:pyruvate/2-oxoglutarate dehydrogenase complex dihydrolipoamide acyltransferase (E2) component